MRQALDKALRSKLERAVIQAREVVELAAKEALERFGISDGSAPDYLTDEERKLRNRLRAHGRVLGDMRSAKGEQDSSLLVRELAYEHWHRMLFARYLEQNNLLMYDEHTAVTLDECAELAEDEAEFADGWAYAGHLAQKMLPQLFRTESPVFAVKLSINHIRTLEALVMDLSPQTFQASDSLGWCYQFWQSKRKDEVNASGVKIGARELSPVTQLFTEPYMVSFLLDNALGAWWANKHLTQDDVTRAGSEQDLREWAAIEGVPLEYLRFVKRENEDGSYCWSPAAGAFEQWPEALSELKTLDPCCGSGHFLVAVFLMLVPMRMALEDLSAAEAVDQVLRQNIHGLELDQRCVELAAFTLALEAWRYPDAGGYRVLPELNLACTGISVKAAKDEWKALGLDKHNLKIALDWMYDTFEQAPVLGSLINPKKSNAAKIVAWDELHSVVGQALQQEEDQHGDTANQEAGIVASGLVKAAGMLSDEYQWVVTNVPYLARGKQGAVLKKFCEQYYPAGKNDLATVFLDRCLELCVTGGTSSVVLPQNWLFLTSYKKFREKMLKQHDWHLIARLGPKGFQTPMWDFNVQLLSMSRGQDRHEAALLDQASDSGVLRGVDVADLKTAEDKAAQLVVEEIKTVRQAAQLGNPDYSIKLEDTANLTYVGSFANCYQGLTTGDDPRLKRLFWEFAENQFHGFWEKLQGTSQNKGLFAGREGLVDTNITTGALKTGALRGRDAWGKLGVAIDRVASLSPALYYGNYYHSLIPVLIPKDKINLLAILAFATSEKLKETARSSNQALSIDNGYFEKFEFDMSYWRKAGEQQYPNGLPQPYTSDPSQWIYHGHPCGSVIWHDTQKQTAHSDLRQDETVLQTAVTRLLGYRWPAETDPDMELAPQMREWVAKCSDFDGLTDDDGIACLPAVRGELSAADRLVPLLEAAYGEEWNLQVQTELLKSVKASSLEVWLRDKFFIQHCKMFQHRPLIWQVWDGLKDGFSALVNYHKLDHDNLDRLIYTYLGDWIRTQEHGVKNGVDGADIRLVAAENLKRELEAIKEGEAKANGKSGYDIFVRWKPLEEQAIGWQPDLNDGVRLNIRPFMSATDMGKKGAGILRDRPNIHWKKDRGNDVASAPWYTLGEQYGEKVGARINDYHLTLAEKKTAREQAAKTGKKESIEGKLI